MQHCIFSDHLHCAHASNPFFLMDEQFAVTTIYLVAPLMIMDIQAVSNCVPSQGGWEWIVTSFRASGPWSSLYPSLHPSPPMPCWCETDVSDSSAGASEGWNSSLGACWGLHNSSLCQDAEPLALSSSLELASHRSRDFDCLHLVAVWTAGVVASPAQLSRLGWAVIRLWFHKKNGKQMGSYQKPIKSNSLISLTDRRNFVSTKLRMMEHCRIHFRP